MKFTKVKKESRTDTMELLSIFIICFTQTTLAASLPIYLNGRDSQNNNKEVPNDVLVNNNVAELVDQLLMPRMNVIRPRIQELGRDVKFSLENHDVNYRAGNPIRHHDPNGVNFQFQKGDVSESSNAYLLKLYQSLVKLREKDEKLKKLCNNLSASKMKTFTTMVKRVFICGEKIASQMSMESLTRPEDRLTTQGKVFDELEDFEIIISDLPSDSWAQGVANELRDEPTDVNDDDTMEPHHGGPPGVWG